MRDWKQDHDPVGLAKMILWEEAKGKLRAMVAAGGSIPSNAERSADWHELEKRVERFIKQVEDDELQM
jgi:hypothetical protein